MEWDIIFDNCWWSWIICAAAFAVALVMRRSTDLSRRRSGTVLTVFSIPSLLTALASFGLFIYMFFHILSTVNPETHIVNDIKLRDDFNDIENSSLSFLFLLLFMFPIQGIAAIITGSRVLKKGSGKAIGIAAVATGILLLAAAVCIFICMMGVWGDT